MNSEKIRRKLISDFWESTRPCDKSLLNQYVFRTIYVLSLLDDFEFLTPQKWKMYYERLLLLNRRNCNPAPVS